MSNFASVTLIGHLGRDVELKSLSDGTSVANFSLATSRKRRDSETSTWWRCALFGKRGEALAQYLHKGDPVLIQGEPYLRTYTDKEGSERQSLECDVKEWAFVSSKGDRQESGGYTAPQASRPKVDAQAPAGNDFDDDIPF
jgi:single-strand DNA-binding protein